MRRVEAVAGASTWHVVTSLGFTCCGIPPEDVFGATKMLARLVAVDDRCKRAGCRRYWPADLRAVS